LLKKYRRMLENPEPTRHFLALGKGISRDLSELGYENKLVLPPCPVDYGPLPKKKQVVQVTRVVPQKRLEEFGEIASQFSYPFHILGLTNDSAKSYSKRLLSKMPRNVQYHEAPLRSMPKVLQESKIYLYTSHEPGLPIAVVQGIGAGCMPIVPDMGGGREAVELAGVGMTYSNIETATRTIRLEMEANGTEELAQAADKFKPEAFQNRIKEMVS
jgi:glycosyltransferase involved in cell wall biosynthesis